MVLADAYVNHGEALEYDLFHLWNLDINHPTMTVRRLRNFFFRLPYSSETLNDIAEIPREARTWDVNTWMLANIFDGIQFLDWHIICANSRNKPRPPKTYPRPEIKKKINKPAKAKWLGRTIVDKGGESNS